MAGRSITWLNETGDVTLTWEKDRDGVMKKIIQQKMDEGYSFFIVKGNLVTSSYQKVTDVAQIKKRSITMTDKEAEQLVGGTSFAQSTVSQIETTSRATKPSEVVKNNTVATRPIRGG